MRICDRASLSLILLLTACSVGMSTSDMMELPSPLNESGDILAPDQVHEADQKTVADAYRFALREAGLEIDVDEVIEHDAIMIVAHLPSFLNSDRTGGWGQLVRIIVTRPRPGDGNVEVEYDSRRKLAENVTENLHSVRQNVMMLAEDYLIAVAEGLDPEAVLVSSPDTTDVRP